MNLVLKTSKTVAKAALRRYYARNHVRAARTTLAGLEAAYGPLNAEHRKKCDAYAVEVLGSIRFAPWLHVYSHVSGAFKEGWIPDNFFDECVLPNNSGHHGELSGFRSLNSILLGAPEFPDLAAQVNGMIVARDGRIVAAKDLVEVLFRETDRIVFKSDASQSGTGVKVLNRASFDPGQVRALGPGVFQPFVQQHEAFRRIGNSPAVTTLRLTTATDDQGQPRLRAGFLCIGRAKDEHIRAGFDVLVPVDPATGEMSPTGYMPDWRRTDRHPDSGEVFAGFEIPGFEACRAVALRCHARLPFVRCIGWDLTIDAEGAVRILEWNGGHTGIKFSEATQGPCFADLGWQHLRRPA